MPPPMQKKKKKKLLTFVGDGLNALLNTFLDRFPLSSYEIRTLSASLSSMKKVRAPGHHFIEVDLDDAFTNLCKTSTVAGLDWMLNACLGSDRHAILQRDKWISPTGKLIHVKSDRSRMFLYKSGTGTKYTVKFIRDVIKWELSQNNI